MMLLASSGAWNNRRKMKPSFSPIGNITANSTKQKPVTNSIMIFGASGNLGCSWLQEFTGWRNWYLARGRKIHQDYASKFATHLATHLSLGIEAMCRWVFQR
ncbi:hypothetical protein M9H77_16548 [Catharanthus roseus]|uniref:Uncharacterized protein n=1 Tax=Catharanthus roseus TaxID=4058 RepID=A0ACC0B221_CATRO|nr:hypothetical protein M9H77_16548 [Catharanthus roseus]